MGQSAFTRDQRRSSAKVSKTLLHALQKKSPLGFDSVIQIAPAAADAFLQRQIQQNSDIGRQSTGCDPFKFSDQMNDQDPDRIPDTPWLNRLNRSLITQSPRFRAGRIKVSTCCARSAA